ncbi:MAG: peptidoglycan editing factor PgeF [Desulfobacterales bacterium]|nr:peptidoglycan editing factor PgeF [Desulfobacterales bacterium]
MTFTTQNGLSIYQFSEWRRFGSIYHGIFSRKGGVSQGVFQSLNISYGVGDKPSHVQRNRQLISQALGSDQLCFIRQNHGTKIHVLPKNHLPSLNVSPSKLLTGDAMITDIPGLFLGIQVADCQAVMILDPDRGVVANVHSGWRGSIHNIIGQTVTQMQQHFQCQPDTLHAAVGPSLGPCCGEFINYRQEIPSKFWKYRVQDHHFDFWAISHDQLIQTGITPQHILSSQICTKCSTSHFFSYRAEKTTGRFASIIGIL